MGRPETIITAGNYEGDIITAVRKYSEIAEEEVARLNGMNYALFSAKQPPYFMLVLDPIQLGVRVFGGNILVGITSRTPERSLEVLGKMEASFGKMGLEFDEDAKALGYYMTAIFERFNHIPEEAMRHFNPKGKILSFRTPKSCIN